MSKLLLQNERPSDATIVQGWIVITASVFVAGVIFGQWIGERNVEDRMIEQGIACPALDAYGDRVGLKPCIEVE